MRDGALGRRPPPACGRLRPRTQALCLVRVLHARSRGTRRRTGRADPRGGHRSTPASLAVTAASRPGARLLPVRPSLVGAATAAIALLAVSPAAANGRFPASNQIVFSPKDPNVIV